VIESRNLLRGMALGSLGMFAAWGGIGAGEPCPACGCQEKPKSCLRKLNFCATKEAPRAPVAVALPGLLGRESGVRVDESTIDEALRTQVAKTVRKPEAADEESTAQRVEKLEKNLNQLVDRVDELRAVVLKMAEKQAQGQPANAPAPR
jgi:hypothetical protein